MKNILTIALAALLWNCSSDNNNNTITISGSITEMGDPVFSIMGDNLQKDISVAEDGTFSDTLNAEEGYYNISHNREVSVIFLKPGFDLQISLDTREFDESISYTGSGSVENNYLAARFMFEEVNSLPANELYSLDEADFKMNIKELEEAQLNMLNTLEGADPSFVEIEKQNIRYGYLLKLFNYPSYHRHFSDNKDYAPSGGFLDPVDAVDKDNEADFKMFSAYRTIVENAFFNGLDADAGAQEKLAAIKKLNSVSIKNSLIKRLAYELKPGAEEAEVLYNGIVEMSDDEAFNEKITEKYEKIKKLTSGNDSPAFSFQNTTGDLVSLQSMAGNLVYIDVWATWCGPCKREIPYLKELEESYRDKEVEFVSISIDREKDHQKWLDMVQEKELKGVQLFADKNWDSDFVKQYAIEGIPRFILIDKNGKIIHPDAPRPSSGDEIRALLNEHLDVG